MRSRPHAANLRHLHIRGGENRILIRLERLEPQQFIMVRLRGGALNAKPFRIRVERFSHKNLVAENEQCPSLSAILRVSAGSKRRHFYLTPIVDQSPGAWQDYRRNGPERFPRTGAQGIRIVVARSAAYNAACLAQGAILPINHRIHHAGQADL